MGELEGKLALVTGAAQGIGKAIADSFRSEGATVIGVDRQSNETEITFDLLDLDGIAALVDGLPVCPDILVNAAGICLTRPFENVDLAGFQQTLALNVIAPFALLQAIAERLKAEGRTGSLINIASNSGFAPKLEQLDYGASKAALVSLTRSSALSLGPHNIRVNAIAPGIIDTPMTQANAKRRETIRGISTEAVMQQLVSLVPVGRIGTAQEVAQVAVFLASARSSFVTGQTYLVDGGQMMR